MTRCTLPENHELSLTPCPDCGSLDVEESGDDFDGMVNCSKCGLATYLCYGTKTAIKVWNERINRIYWGVI